MTRRGTIPPKRRSSPTFTASMLFTDSHNSPQSTFLTYHPKNTQFVLSLLSQIDAQPELCTHTRLFTGTVPTPPLDVQMTLHQRTDWTPVQAERFLHRLGEMGAAPYLPGGYASFWLERVIDNNLGGLLRALEETLASTAPVQIVIHDLIGLAKDEEDQDLHLHAVIDCIGKFRTPATGMPRHRLIVTQPINSFPFADPERFRLHRKIVRCTDVALHYNTTKDNPGADACISGKNFFAHLSTPSSGAVTRLTIERDGEHLRNRHGPDGAVQPFGGMAKDAAPRIALILEYQRRLADGSLTTEVQWGVKYDLGRLEELHYLDPTEVPVLFEFLEGRAGETTALHDLIEWQTLIAAAVTARHKRQSASTLLRLFAEVIADGQPLTDRLCSELLGLDFPVDVREALRILAVPRDSDLWKTDKASKMPVPVDDPRLIEILTLNEAQDLWVTHHLPVTSFDDHPRGKSTFTVTLPGGQPVTFSSYSGEVDSTSGFVATNPYVAGFDVRRLRSEAKSRIERKREERAVNKKVKAETPVSFPVPTMLRAAIVPASVGNLFKPRK